MNISTRFRAIAFMILMLGLSSCIPISSANFTFDFQPMEKWRLSIQVAAPPEYSDVLEPRISGIATDPGLQSLHIQVKTKKLDALPNGDIPHQIQFDGQGYENLNQIWGSEVVSISGTEDNRIVSFNLNPYTIYSQMTPNTTVVTVKGGKILSTNGSVSNNTVTWTNPSDVMQIEMQEPSWSDYLPQIIIGGGLLIVILVGILGGVLLMSFRRRKVSPVNYQPPLQKAYPSQSWQSLSTPQMPPYQPSQPPQQPVPPQSPPARTRTLLKYCVQCNSQIPAHSVFCPICGAKQ